MRTIEYAGFKYTVTLGAGDTIVAVPLKGQHPAAWKEKHRRAAVEQYLQELKDMPDICPDCGSDGACKRGCPSRLL